MELDIILWMGGMLFSLGIFAVKVGVGFGFGEMKWKGVASTLGLYLGLFVVLALLAGRISRLLEPILRKGPWLHLLVATGLIGWGIYLVLANGESCRHDRPEKSFLLLVIPCPVCLAAMTFSTATALTVIPWHPALVGLAVGGVFAVLILLVHLVARTFSRARRPLDRRIGLGMAMVAIGLYFIASLFLPGYIEQAKGVYGSFAGEVSHASNRNIWGIMGVLLAAMAVGFFIPKQLEN